jgi:hypothetical protein
MKSSSCHAAALRALGLARLSSDLASSETRRALHAHLQGTGLTLERLAPNQRHTFAWLVENWTAGIAVADSTVPAVTGNKVACSKERPTCPT